MAKHLSQHLEESSRQFCWTDKLDVVLGEIAAITKLIASNVRKGALDNNLVGSTNYRNVHDEEVKRLDEWANAILCKRLERCGQVKAMASEEVEGAIEVLDPNLVGEYIVMFDPLDGSSNIDVNATIGTIFSVHHWPRSRKERPDLLLKGSEQVAAGYTTYGPSTMFVYTAKNGVHGFTLDPEIGEYIQTHADIRCPPQAAIYSINEGNRNFWSPQQRQLTSWYQEADKETKRPYSSRYIGSLVADFHRTWSRVGSSSIQRIREARGASCVISMKQHHWR